MADGALALLLGTSGMFTAPSMADSLGLPVEWLLLAAISLLPYGARALQSGIPRRAIDRARAEGLALFNVVVVVTVVGIAAMVSASPVRDVEPTVWGWAYIAAYIAIPAAVAVCVSASLIRRR